MWETLPSSANRFPLWPSEMCLALAKSVQHPLLSDTYAHAARDELPSTVRGSSVWQVPLGERRRPALLGATPGVTPPAPQPDRGALGDLSENRKARPGRPASPARLSRRAPGTSSGVQAAHLPACNRRVLRRATGASCGAQPARLAARNRRVSLRASGTSQRRAVCAIRRTPTRARARDIGSILNLTVPTLVF